MMKWIVLAIVVALLTLSAVNYFKAKEYFKPKAVEKREKLIEKEARPAPVPVIDRTPEMVYVKSGPIAPGVLVESDNEVYQVGYVSKHGYVEAIHDNIARCIEGPKVRLVVFSRPMTEVREVDFFGKIDTAVVTSAGTFKLGTQTHWGHISKVEQYFVQINRVDGGRILLVPRLDFRNDVPEVTQAIVQSSNDLSEPQLPVLK